MRPARPTAAARPRRRLRAAPTLALALALLATPGSAGCPNACNGHGRCTAVAKCECFGGWSGGDCSRRSCPLGAAWADVATADDTAHALAECSNRGACNAATGQCACMSGYEGLACNRMTCPDGCGAHGTCRSMKYHAALFDKGLQPRSFYYSYASNWDAEHVYGCSCDGGYSGYNCGERACPTGDDPLTTGQVDEVQYLRCDYPATATPAWTLSLKGVVTASFSGSTNPAQLRALLEALPTVGTVSVTYSTGVTFCNQEFAGTVPPGSNAVAVTFRTDHGAQPSLVVLDEAGSLLTGADDNAIDVQYGGASLTYATGAGTTASAVSVVGSKENALCSGRGACDRLTGLCACFSGFAASDGLGGAGDTPDCGYNAGVVAACPGAAGLIECSGHGTCVAGPTTVAGVTYSYACDCNTGWGGGACSERACPASAAWFDYPSAVDTAHAAAECSGKGRCNRASGVCDCQPLFEGAACERMTCPGKTAGGAACSGHGACLSMAQLAATASVNGEAVALSYGADPARAATWDAGKVMGCHCDAGWGGYDCSAATCALGEDVTAREWDSSLTDETQSLTCVALAGLAGSPTFRLQFRDALTAALPYGASRSAVEAALEALPTLGDVTVALTTVGGSTPAAAACQAAPGTRITVGFVTEHGDVPPLRVAMAGLDGTTGLWAAGLGWADTDLQWAGGDPASAPDYSTPLVVSKAPGGYAAEGVRALEVTKGTSATAECSGRGYCNTATGLCACFRGFGASDGARGRGSISDCGYREAYWPQALRGAGE